ncbi:MAG: autophagy protein atg9 [Lichina confinis]|nr:MAG: autophagy protein atg9 [Lichina confinis]
MAASNLLSRLLPPTTGSPSVYETLKQHDESSDASDVEERAGLALDEENLGQQFEGHDLDQAEAAALEDSPAPSDESPPPFEGDIKLRRSASWAQNKAPGGQPSRPRWMSPGGPFAAAEEGDDEVPPSLLIEGGEDPTKVSAGGKDDPMLRDHYAVPGPSSAQPRTQWRAARTRQSLYHDDPRTTPPAKVAPRMRKGLTLIDPRERAMWRWANVENLDNFLKDVYDYYLGKGIWSIMLSRVLNLLTLGFVVGFSTFLTMCIDYRKVPHSRTMSQILIPRCTKNMSGSANFLVWLFSFFWIAKLFQYVIDIRRLRHMQEFYLYLLDIPGTDIQTISWQEVVSRLVLLRDANPVTADGVGRKHRRFMGSQSKQRMDAHDIANRLMRKENYLIALFNKEILDLTLPIPFLQNRQFFSRTLEWNLTLCILDFVFNEQGQVRPLFLRDTHRRALSDGLRRRFIFAGFMNVICAPFIVLYLIMLYFFRYFTEYQKNPSQIGSRQYTPLAEWKLREFNELWHLFQRRLNMSSPFASRYVDQFPKDKTVQVSRFVAFVAGALAAVLAVASVVDPELFLGFEVTPERTVLFYLGLFGTVWAVARGAVPEENLVFDPEYALNNVIEYTHYLPAHWRGRLHSDEVRRDFARLYRMKILIFAEELLSLVFTPFILWFSLPKCSDRVVDFFREFTVHVDGLGYVCSFAVFDFKRGANVGVRGDTPDGDGARLREDYYSTNDGKMMASYYGFIDNYSRSPRTRAGPSQFAAPRPHDASAGAPSHAGVGTTALAPDTSVAGSSRGDRPVRPSARAALAGSIAQARRPGQPTALGPREPGASMASMLLDAQQPSSFVQQRSPRQRPQGRYQSGSHPLAEDVVVSELEHDAAPTQLMADATSSGSGGGIGDDSNLGESWKTTRAAAVGEEDDEGDERIDGMAGDGEVGVLGLLYQFQRARTEGRGGGVGF